MPKKPKIASIGYNAVVLTWTPYKNVTGYKVRKNISLYFALKISLVDVKNYSVFWDLDHILFGKGNSICAVYF